MGHTKSGSGRDEPLVRRFFKTFKSREKEGLNEDENKPDGNSEAKAQQLTPPASSVEDSELNKALDELKKTYDKFIDPASKVVQVEAIELTDAIKTADAEISLRDSAQSFQEKVTKVIGRINERQEIRNAKWTGTLSNFLIKFYPLARFSLQLTSAVAQVSTYVTESAYAQGASFNPLKGAADGLLIILQIIINTSDRKEQFYIQLKRIECQAERIAQNRNYDEMPEQDRERIQKRGVDLMTAIIQFFNSALCYFSYNFGRKVLVLNVVDFRETH